MSASSWQSVPGPRKLRPRKTQWPMRASSSRPWATVLLALAEVLACGQLLAASGAGPAPRQATSARLHRARSLSPFCKEAT